MWLLSCAKFRFCPSATMNEFTPITSPRELISGPPDDPCEIGAVVWITGTPLTMRFALTMPVLTVPCMPNGLPTATTLSPTTTVSGLPSGNVLTLIASGASSSAKSCCSSIRAETTANSRLSRVTTLTIPPSPLTTCMLVTTRRGSIKKPLPLFTSWPRLFLTSTVTSVGNALAAMASVESAGEASRDRSAAIAGDVTISMPMVTPLIRQTTDRIWFPTRWKWNEQEAWNTIRQNCYVLMSDALSTGPDHQSDRILVMTYRPGRTKPIVDIDLPRSRSSEIVGSEAFGLHVAAIWSDFEGRGEPRHEGRQGCARKDLKPFLDHLHHTPPQRIGLRPGEAAQGPFDDQHGEAVDGRPGEKLRAVASFRR